MIRGVRGAITVNDNNETEIVSNTKRLVEEMISTNEILPEQIASVFLSVTEDVTAAFPAKALRLLDGWTYVPVMCMQEMPVPGAVPLCIRVMIHVNTHKSQQDVHHVYLEKASVLRPDLNNNNK